MQFGRGVFGIFAMR